jgi:hypothetical protein
MNFGGCIGAAEEAAEDMVVVDMVEADMVEADVVEADVEIRTRINLNRPITNSY